MLSVLRTIAALGCAAGVQAGLGAQQTIAPALPEAAAEPGPDILSIARDANFRMTVPVSVGGQGPYQFLVDTGAERTVISRELAERLKLDEGKNVQVHSMTEVTSVGTRIIPDLEISKRTLNDIQAPALAAAHLGAAGMLGVDSLQSQRVVFDFGEQTMTVTPSRKRLRNWGPDAIVITGRNLYGRLVLLDAEVEGQKVRVILDTGSEVSIGNEALRRKLIGKKRLGSTQPILLTSVTGGKLQVDYTWVRRIRLGNILIEDMPIGFADVHPFRQLHLLDQPAMLLGMDALRLFDRVSVDFARREVQFLPEGSAGSGFRLAGLRRAAAGPS